MYKDLPLVTGQGQEPSHLNTCEQAFIHCVKKVSIQLKSRTCWESCSSHIDPKVLPLLAHTLVDPMRMRWHAPLPWAAEDSAENKLDTDYT